MLLTHFSLGTSGLVCRLSSGAAACGRQCAVPTTDKTMDQAFAQVSSLQTNSKQRAVCVGARARSTSQQWAVAHRGFLGPSTSPVASRRARRLLLLLASRLSAYNDQWWHQLQIGISGRRQPRAAVSPPAFITAFASLLSRHATTGLALLDAS